MNREIKSIKFYVSLPVKPKSVNILTKEKQVSADKRYEVECRTVGSRPEAVITWWKGSRPIKRLAKNVSNFIYLYTVYTIYKHHLAVTALTEETFSNCVFIL